MRSEGAAAHRRALQRALQATPAPSLAHLLAALGDEYCDVEAVGELSLAELAGGRGDLSVEIVLDALGLDCPVMDVPDRLGLLGARLDWLEDDRVPSALRVGLAELDPNALRRAATCLEMPDAD